MALRAFADGALFAESIGSGPPDVLALHGWGRRGSDFGACLEGMSALAPDLPGFGASPPPDRVLGAAGYAELLGPVLDEFEHPPLVVGHSFGGRVAVCLAAEHPERVGPVVLTGAPLLRPGPGAKPRLSYRMMRSLNRMGAVSDRRMEALRRRSGSSDYRAATGVMREVLVKVIHESYEEQLQAIESAVTLVWGSDDHEVPPAVARLALDLLEASGVDCTLEVLPGVGHLVPVQAPDQLRRAIDRVMTA